MMARSALAGLTVCIALLGAVGSAGADPYEIPARWVESDGMLSPIGVDFTFTRIERVPGLGVVAYGDRLLLRITDDESPFVTLGIAGRRFVEDSQSYTSVAPRADVERWMSVSRVIGDASSIRRETELRSVNLDGGNAEAVTFPPSSDSGAEWSSIALFTNGKGNVLALAARTPPVTRVAFDSPPAAALEQRVFSLDGASWKPRTDVDPAELSVGDACVAGDAFVIVGTTLLYDASHKLLERRGGAAVLTPSGWVKQLPAAPPGAAGWGFDRIACGSTDDNVVALGTTAADAQSMSRQALLGPSVLYRFDGSRWYQIENHPGAAPSAKSRFTRVSAIGVAPDRSLWVAYERPDDPARELYRYAGGKWRPYRVPPVPTISRYVIRGIAFDDQGKGWAITNLEGAADHPESHGILLHFDGETWEERPWTWSPLKQRWFGLFGNLS